MVLSVALLRATDHDGPRSRIGQAAAAVLCGEGKVCSMEIWHETLLVLFGGRIIGRCCCCCSAPSKEPRQPS